VKLSEAALVAIVTELPNYASILRGLLGLLALGLSA